MNVIKSVTERIERRRLENKNPCKSFATEAAAERATAKAAALAGRYFDRSGRPAQYVVFFVEPWGRWVGAMSYSELLSRPTAQGGYLGAVAGFFTY